MPCYAIIIREHLRDQEEMNKYSSTNREGQQHKMKVLAMYGKHETVEGAENEGCVILEFKDMAAAKAWYDSPGYQKARKHRWLGADYRIFFVEGLPEPMQVG
jgi:uncharacterized protein (DUF1330 family)